MSRLSKGQNRAQETCNLSPWTRLNNTIPEPTLHPQAGRTIGSSSQGVGEKEVPPPPLRALIEEDGFKLQLYPQSPRNVTIEYAKLYRERLPSGIMEFPKHSGTSPLP